MKERKVKFFDQYKFFVVIKGLYVKGSVFFKLIKIYFFLVYLEICEEVDIEYVFFYIDGD